MLLLVACSVHKTATSDRVSTSTHIERVLVDSVVLRDIIVIRERCDTVFFTKYSTLYKERLRVDTVVKCDTLYAERTVTVSDKGNRGVLWWLLLPVIAVLWKIGVFDLLRNLILRKN